METIGTIDNGKKIIDWEVERELLDYMYRNSVDQLCGASLGIFFVALLVLSQKTNINFYEWSWLVSDTFLLWWCGLFFFFLTCLGVLTKFYSKPKTRKAYNLFKYLYYIPVTAIAILWSTTIHCMHLGPYQAFFAAFLYGVAFSFTVGLPGHTKLCALCLSIILISLAAWFIFPYKGIAHLAMGVLSLVVILLLMKSNITSGNFLREEYRKVLESNYKQANYDLHTDLPNQNLLNTYISSTIQAIANEGVVLGLIFIYIDQLEEINEGSGHEEGSLVLQAIAKRISNYLAEEYPNNAKLFYTWSSLFVIPLTTTYVTNLHRTLTDLAAIFNRPFYIGDKPNYVTASIGMSIYPDHDKTVGQLIHSADLAMYAAKQTGGDCIQVYNEDLEAKYIERRNLENDLNKALDKNELSVVVQAQVDVNTRKITAGEVLVRWYHPERGPISPAVFIPLAERSGLIHNIGRFVFSEVCRIAKLIDDLGFNDIKISYNLSARQIGKNVIAIIKEELEKSRAKVTNIEIELTEGMAFRDDNHTKEIIRQLKELGFSLSIDDFGQGYANFTYLNRAKIPSNKVKIDQEIVKNFFDYKIILKHIIAMVNDLGIEVIAEGVENEEVMRYLYESGCHRFQGYYFSYPAPLDDFINLLHNQKELFDKKCSQIKKI